MRLSAPSSGTEIAANEPEKTLWSGSAVAPGAATVTSPPRSISIS